MTRPVRQRSNPLTANCHWPTWPWRQNPPRPTSDPGSLEADVVGLANGIPRTLCPDILHDPGWSFLGVADAKGHRRPILVVLPSWRSSLCPFRLLINNNSFGQGHQTYHSIAAAFIFLLFPPFLTALTQMYLKLSYFSSFISYFPCRENYYCSYVRSIFTHIATIFFTRKVW